MGEHGGWESSVTSTPQAGLCQGPMELSPRGFKVFSAVPLCINCCLMPTTLCYTASPASQQEKGVHSTVVVMCKWVSLACLSKVQFSILGHHSPERWQGRVIITGTVIEWQQWQSQQRTFSLAPVMARSHMQHKMITFDCFDSSVGKMQTSPVYRFCNGGLRASKVKFEVIRVICWHVGKWSKEQKILPSRSGPNFSQPLTLSSQFSFCGATVPPS